MDSRIPLSIVLGSSNRKHETIPSRTYSAPSSSAFFRYLRSDDTRLPRHRLLQTYVEPAENYNTYVGEEDWTGEPDAVAAEASRTASDSDVSVGPPPPADEIVDWVSAVLAEPWAEDGVVLCGRYTVADDCAWATSSRSSRLMTVREVFVAMRGSNKFFQDVKYQLDKAHTGVAEFTIAKAVSAEESRELRVFVPCLVTLGGSRTDADSQRGAHCEVGSLQYEYAGVSQRVTEACFPSLMQWSEELHDVIHRRLVERVKAARVLEHTLEADPAWCDRLVRHFHRHTRAPVASTSAEVERLWLLLSVDVLFENLQLPIYLLSAKARLFAPSTLAAHLDTHAPFVLEPVDDIATAGAPIRTEATEANEEEGDDEDEDDDWEAAREAADVRSFLRLFRDEFNWNQYTSLLHHRLDSHDGSANTPMRYFCAIASEASDLVTCGDTLTKRGLALEFSRPELLAHNPQAMQHVQEFLQQQLQE